MAVTQAQENQIVNKALSAMPAQPITGMTLGADISLGNLILNTIDGDDIVWVCTDINGWWTTPDPEMPDLARGWGNGSYDATGRYSARFIELSGTFLVPEPALVPVARQKLLDAIDLIATGSDLVVNEDPAKTSYVKLVGRPEISTVNARGRTEFLVSLKAADPIKYEYLPSGTDIQDGFRTKTIATATPTVFNNTGSTKTPVVIELTGPIPVNATIQNSIDYVSADEEDTVETIKVVKAVPSGSKLEIDTYNREVLLVTGSTIANGRSYISTLSAWVYVQPDSKASNTITFTSATGSCKIFYKSGWIG